MRWVLAAVIAALFLAGRSEAADPLLAPTSVCRPGSSTEMRCLHLYARKQAGLPPLTAASGLFESANRKANRIIECGVFTHQPCGELDAPAGMYWGENLAYGYTIRGAFAAWLASPGHRANILNPTYRLYGSAFRGLGPFPRLWVVQFGA